MKKAVLSSLLIFLCHQFLFAQQDYHGLLATGQDQFTHIPPPSTGSSGLRSATFNITYNSFTPEAQTAFQYAADIWGSILVSDIPIKVNTYFIPLLPGLLGITLPNGRKNFNGALQSNTWYASCLANALADSELNAGENDFDLFLNSSFNWYYGTDGNCPAGKYDLATVVLHEMCHGFGFVGLAKSENNLGSFGLVTDSDFLPIVTSFPFPELEGLPGDYDNFMFDVFDNPLTNTILFPNNSSILDDAFTSNSIFFEGDYATAGNNGMYPRLYAPNPFSLGSSLVHLDENSYPSGNINDLMTPYAGTAEVTHDPGPITMGVLRDLGWQVNYNVGIQEGAGVQHELKLFPNPVKNNLTIAGTPAVIEAVTITDVTGRVVLTATQPHFPLDVSTLPPGIFLCSVMGASETYTAKFIKL